MLQEIITYIIVLGTVVYTILRILAFFQPGKGGCSGCAGGCGLKQELANTPKIKELVQKKLMNSETKRN